MFPRVISCLFLALGSLGRAQELTPPPDPQPPAFGEATQTLDPREARLEALEARLKELEAKLAAQGDQGPSSFNGVERALFSKVIVPSTWS